MLVNFTQVINFNILFLLQFKCDICDKAFRQVTKANDNGLRLTLSS